MALLMSPRTSHASESTIALDAAALNQFDASVMLPAADFLADAKVDAIAWNGTSASWLGIGRDRSLCEAITVRTSVPATTSTLACIDAARALGANRVGLVSPYTDDVQRRIGDVWAEEGIAPHAERHLGLRDNFSFGEVTPATIADMIRAVAADGADAVVILCTNLDGAALAASLERELNVAVLDFGRGDAVADAGARRRRHRGSCRLGPDLPDIDGHQVMETPVTQLDLAIRGGTIVTASDEFRADIGIRDGRIVSIADHLEGSARDRRNGSAGAAGRDRQPCPHLASRPAPTW